MIYIDIILILWFFIGMVKTSKITSAVVGVTLAFALAGCNGRSASDYKQNFTVYFKFK